MFCVCGLYLRLNEPNNTRVAFIDVCNNKYLRERSKFQFYNKELHSIKFYQDLDCNSTINDDSNQNEWAGIPISFDHFQCAKLNSPCESYVVRYYYYLMDQMVIIIFLFFKTRKIK